MAPSAVSPGNDSSRGIVTGLSKPGSDPYAEHHQAFQSAGLPQTEQEWLARAAEVSRILAKDAAQREQDNVSPFLEVGLLKSSGLLKILGPKSYGGGGQGWDVGYKAIREVAKGDGSLGMLLGYHLVWSTTANIVGTDQQKDELQKLIIEQNYFIGGEFAPKSHPFTIPDMIQVPSILVILICTSLLMVMSLSSMGTRISIPEAWSLISLFLKVSWRARLTISLLP